MATMPAAAAAAGGAGGPPAAMRPAAVSDAAAATKKRKPRKPKRRVVPLGGVAVLAAVRPVTSRKLARRLTSAFHALLNEEAVLQAQSSRSAADVARLRAIEAELAAMGGRERYQAASALSTREYRSSRLLFKLLVRLGLQPRRGEAPLRVLEIGAVNAQLSVVPWLRTRAIDIVSHDAHVEQCDFFDVPVLDAVRGEYEVVVCSMVLNCVPVVLRRAEMLVRCHDHLVPGGLLFFALPTRCLDVSSFVTRRRVECLFLAAGFAIVQRLQTPKISTYVLQRRDALLWRQPGLGLPVGAGDESGAASDEPSITAYFAAGTGRLTIANTIREATAAGGEAGAAVATTGGADTAAAAAAAGVKRKRDIAGEAAAHGGGAAKRARMDRCAAASDDASSSDDDDDEAGSGGHTLLPYAGIRMPDAAGLTALRRQLEEAAARYAAAHAGASSAAGGSGSAAAAKPWRPVLLMPAPGGRLSPAQSEAIAAIGKLLAPPTELPKAELPVTGFSRTDFALQLDKAWVRYLPAIAGEAATAAGTSAGGSVLPARVATASSSSRHEGVAGADVERRKPTAPGGHPPKRGAAEPPPAARAHSRGRGGAR